MKKIFFLAGALLFASYNLKAQGSTNIIYFDTDGSHQGSEGLYINGGVAPGRSITTFRSYTTGNISEVNFRANRELRVKGDLFADSNASFARTVNFNSGFSVNSGNVNLNLGSFLSKGSASFIAHIDRNSNDPNVDTFKVLYGTNGAKIFDVGINSTKLFSRNFISENDGEFVVNIDKNNNSQVDKFKILYGREKSEILVAGKDDVIIHKKLITQNNIETKNIKALDILANKVVLNVGSFPDYVFSKNYKLMPLTEVATFIKKNKHLPNMPSEADVVTNGMDVKQINTVLVEKVEELTLHTISQEEKINKLENKLKVPKEESIKMKKNIEVLLKRISNLENQFKLLKTKK